MELFLFMTLSASLLILAGLALRPLTGRIVPRSVQMLLWIAASLRLLLPLEIHVPVHIFGPLIESVQPAAAVQESFQSPLPTAAPAEAGIPLLSPSTQTGQSEIVYLIAFSELLPWIWLIGATVMVCILLILHIREMHRCCFKVRDKLTEMRTPRFIRVYRCETLSAPFVSGLFCPKIILPAALPEEELSAVLAHELAHICGLDILKKYLFATALCVQWFNPLVWIMVHFSAQDLEILCDRRALRRPDAPQPKAYAHALLNTEERRALFTLSFKSNTEVRIMKVLKKEKPNRLAAMISILLVVLLTAACAVQPAVDTETPLSLPSAVQDAGKALTSAASHDTFEAPSIESNGMAEERSTVSKPQSAEDVSEYTVGLYVIQTEEDAYETLEHLDAEIEHLNRQKDQIAKLLDTWEQDDLEALQYRQAAMELLDKNASEHTIREQIAWLKAEDALGFIARSLPDTTGKECVQINVKREDNDEILSSHIVPKEDCLQYLNAIKNETAEADVYVSFILLQ